MVALLCWDLPVAMTTSGGSPIGNSRVKITNVADCVKRGLVKEGDVPLEVGLINCVSDTILSFTSKLLMVGSEVSASCALITV